MLKPYTEYSDNKPSLGVKPRRLHDSMRRQELLTALLAREKQDGTMLDAWLDEYIDLLPNYTRNI